MWPLWTTYTVLGLVALFVARRWPWTAPLWFFALPISYVLLFDRFYGFPYADPTPVLIAVVLALAGAFWGLRRRRRSQSGLTRA